MRKDEPVRIYADTAKRLVEFITKNREYNKIGIISAAVDEWLDKQGGGK